MLYANTHSFVIHIKNNDFFDDIKNDVKESSED